MHTRSIDTKYVKPPYTEQCLSLDFFMTVSMHGSSIRFVFEQNIISFSKMSDAARSAQRIFSLFISGNCMILSQKKRLLIRYGTLSDAAESFSLRTPIWRLSSVTFHHKGALFRIWKLPDIIRSQCSPDRSGKRNMACLGKICTMGK